MKKLLALLLLACPFGLSQSIITATTTDKVPNYNAVVNGLVGNGSTDNSAALQAIVDGCAATGCRIYFPCGVYKFNTGITTGAAQGIHFEGQAVTGWNNSVNHCVRLTTASAIVILTMGTTSDIQNGGAIENIAFEDTSAGTAIGGLLLNRTSRIPMRSLEFDNFMGAGHYGIKLDGGAGFDNHNSIWDVRMRAVQTGIIVAGGADGPDIYGGDIALDDTATGPIGIDIQQTASSTVKMFGPSIDMLGTNPVGIKIAGDGNYVSGVKLEGATSLANCVTKNCIGIQVTSTGGNNHISVDYATKLNVVVQLDSGSSSNIVTGVGTNNTADVTDAGDLNDIWFNGANDHALQIHTTTTAVATPLRFEGFTQPGSGSVKLTRMLVPTSRGLLFQQTSANQGGGYLNADNILRWCIGGGLYGSCSTAGVTASGTSATLIVGGNTAGQFDFYTNTSLTAGNTFTPTLRTSINATGLTVVGVDSATSFTTGTAVWKSGTGSPESVLTAPIGSMYTRTDGGANTTLYIKESGAGNTGWIAK